jgi:uncharacterized protein (TIGR02996 family)
MDGDEGFVAAIRANPQEDALRLIYADWLAERGDSRAAYLRLQVTIAARLQAGENYEELRSDYLRLAEAIPLEWREQVGKTFDVVLESFPPGNKIYAIGAVSSLLKLPLRQAKNLVEAAPVCILGGRLLENAERLKEEMEVLPLQEGFPSLPSDQKRCCISIRNGSGTANELPR